MNEYIKKIIQNATFDDGIFAEKISYNGMEISAIVEGLVNDPEKVRSEFNRRSDTIVLNGGGVVSVKKQ